MIIVVLFSTIALLLTFLESRGITKGGMKIGFILVGLLGCIHYNYGNDYMRYMEVYEELITQPFVISDIISDQYFREPGWYVINYVFQYLGGFFALVAFLNFIQTIIVYKFIKRYVDKKWYTLAVFTYLFTTSYYLLSFSMMRQELVIIIFLGLWRFISERKWWIALPVLLLCTTIHMSSWALVPFAFWGYLPKNKTIIALMYVGILASLWLLSDLLGDMMNTIMSFEEFDYYADNYGRDNRMKLGMGFWVQLLPFFLSIYYFVKGRASDDKEVRLVALALVFFLVTPFGQLMPMIGRVGMYFGIYRMASLPIIYKSVHNMAIRSAFISLNVIVTLYDYWYFFHDPIYAKSFSEFHTIFSVLW